ncbi:MAG: hypothetical protein AAF702_36260 [Chloroflexota bacterium]
MTHNPTLGSQFGCNKISLFQIRWLIIAASALFLYPQLALAQDNRPPQVEPVADREMFEDDLILISLNASDPNKEDSVTFIEEPSLLPLPQGARLLDSGTGNGSAVVEFAPVQAGIHNFAIVAVDDGEPEGRTAVFFNVTVKEKPDTFADLSIDAISVSSQAADGEVRRGTPIDYKIDLFNHGNLDALNSTLTVVLDQELSFAAVVQGAECTQGPTDSGAEEIICDLDTVSAQRGFQLILRLVPEIKGTAINQLRVDTATLDPITNNDSQSHTVEVNDPLVDLAVENRRISGGEKVGDQVSFLVTIYNYSAVGINFVLTDILSAGLEFVSIEGPSDDNCPHTGPTVVCQGRIDAFSNKEYTLIAQVISDGWQQTQAIIGGEAIDPSPSNNDYIARFRVKPVADLKVALSVVDLVNEYKVGDLIFTKIAMEVVSDAYTATLENAHVDYSIGAGLTFVRVDAPTDLDCILNSSVLSCTKARLQSGQRIEIPVVLLAVAAGLWDHSATVGAFQYIDSAPNNEQSLGQIEVVEPVSPMIHVQTFVDLNKNGRQDPGETSLPGVKIETNILKGQETDEAQGNTDEKGMIQLPMPTEPDKLKVTATFTPSQEMTPTVSVSINAVPSTGKALITGSSSCGMTVHNTSGDAVMLPCTEESSLEWKNQVNASVAKLTARLQPSEPRVFGASGVLQQPAEVSFEITNQEENLSYLPLMTQ